jgi:hypothetical protein
VPTDEPRWLLGFFTGRLHAVADPATRLVFRGVPLAWAICGAPVVVHTDGSPGPYCPACLLKTADFLVPRPLPAA